MATATLLLVFLGCLDRTASKPQWLYKGIPGAEHVTELDETALEEVIRDGRLRAEGSASAETAWVVAFYAPWCGHCQHFAPVWAKVGRELDASRARAAALNCVAYESSCTRHRIRSYPTLKAFHMADLPDSQQPFGHVVKMGRGFDAKRWIEQHTSPEGQAVAAAAEDTSRIAHRAHRAAPAPAASASDAIASVRFVLRHGVFAGRELLSPDEYAALRDWLVLLSVAAPGPQLSRDVIQRLLARVVTATRDGRSLSGLNSSSWAHLLRDGVLEPAADGSPPLPAWTWTASCALANSDGFTCGLWTLLHALTFSAPAAGISPRASAAAIRGFVAHFFACADCRSNFLAMYDGCAYGRCDFEGGDEAQLASLDPAQLHGAPRAPRPAHEQRQLVLWLWRAHNDVNVRLAKENALETAAWEWPSRALCIGCVAPSWDEDRVFDYLASAYEGRALRGQRPRIRDPRLRRPAPRDSQPLSK